MLESCSTIDEAVAFFQTHWEPSFSYAKILIADRTGASVIIGAKDGRLDIKIAKQSRGFGYSGQIVDRMLNDTPPSTVESAGKILEAACQKGENATKYSNVFDLKSGDIFLFRFPEHRSAVKLSLKEELEKGRHSYDIPRIAEQIGK
jgi:hypothetical protein